MTAVRTNDQWRALMDDEPRWLEATSRHDDAEDALVWLTDTLQAVDQQFTDRRPIGKVSADEYAEYLDWKYAASSFKRYVLRRRSDLVRRLKQMRRAESEAESLSYRRRHLAIAALARADVAGEVTARLDFLAPSLRDRVGIELLAVLNTIQAGDGEAGNPVATA